MRGVTSALRAELRQLGRPRFLLLVAAAAATIAAFVSGAAVSSASAAAPPAGGPGPLASLGEVLSAGGQVIGVRAAATLLGLVALTIGVLGMGQELKSGTIRNLLLRHPARRSLLLGKLAGQLLLVLGTVVVAVAAGSLTSWVAATVRGVSVSAWLSAAGFGHIAGAIGGLTLSGLLYLVVGATLALAVRAPAPAIVLGAAWLVAGEALVRMLASGVGSWLPGGVAGEVVNGGTSSVPLAAGLGVLVAWIAVLVLASVTAFDRMEVTA